MTNVWDTKGPSEKQAYASGVSSRDAEVEALRKQLAEFGAGEDTTTMTRKSFAEVLQALADATKELATLREQHSNVLRENECQRQELASNKLVIDQLAHERNDTQTALETANAGIAELGGLRPAVAEIERDEAIARAEELVARQAEDEGLWFMPVTITEDYLQRALRSLHEAVEGKSSSEFALAALNPSPAGREG